MEFFPDTAQCQLPQNTPLCPLDDRYASKVSELRTLLTEPALMQARLAVEIAYLVALSREPGVPELPSVNKSMLEALVQIVRDFNAESAARVRATEKKINHDVKAIEYYLREQIQARQLNLPLQFVHFGLTSEDVTNLAYGLLIHHTLGRVILPLHQTWQQELSAFAEQHINTKLLGMTHGQPATPTTIGEQLLVFTDRLVRLMSDLRQFSMHGKLNGAVGNFSAHYAAYPDVDWPAFSRRLLPSLWVTPLARTAQINPHDDIARLSHLMIETNQILLDLCIDTWLYISRDVLCQKPQEGEVGSSTMPHKVNPIDWESAEGNLGLSTALFEFFARKLPVSRMQRDLSDSTVQRNLGLAFGYHVLALKSMFKGLSKLDVNTQQCQTELVNNPAVHGEAIQTIMRRCGFADAYEQLKKLTRGQEVTAELLNDFVCHLQIPDSDRHRLRERISNAIV